MSATLQGMGLPVAPAAPRLSSSELRRMARYLRPAWGRCALILLCTVAVAGLGVIPPLLIRDILDHALPSRDAVLLAWLVGAMVGVALVGGLITVLRTYLVSTAAHDVMLDLRSSMYQRLLQQPLPFFTTARPGELISRLQSDVGGVYTTVSGTLIALLTNVISVVTTIVVLLNIDWLLTLVALSVLPMFVLPARKVGSLANDLTRQTHEHLAQLSAHSEETLSISGFFLTRLFGTQAYELERYRNLARALRNLGVRISMAGRWFLMWVSTFGTIGPAIIFLVAGFKVMNGTMTIGTMVAFASYLGLLYAPVAALVGVHVDLAKAGALFRRIFEYLDLPMATAPQAARLPVVQGKLCFEDVGMSYGPGKAGVHDISFTAHAGQMVALVGPSGAGKTTLTYLASRLYDPAQGRVTLDGVDLREIAAPELAAHMASVTQEVPLANATVADNLRYGNPQASDAEIERACKLAHVHEVIARLPQGYGTRIGARGYKLSGGEKQRLAIARVLLRDPRILILDEATSALDSQTEAAMQEALMPLLQQRTCLVVAHRLASILRADLILVLDRGRIVERGTHAELLAAGGLYTRLYREQFATPGQPAFS